MCFSNRHLDPKVRRFVALGSACLALGLPLQLLVHPQGQGPKMFVHALYGFLLGLAISFNFAALWLKRRSENRV